VNDIGYVIEHRVYVVEVGVYVIDGESFECIDVTGDIYDTLKMKKNTKDWYGCSSYRKL